MTELTDTQPGCGEMVARMALAMKQRAALPVANLKSLDRVLVGSLGDAWPYLARAAIEAMREPTEAMVDAGHEEIPDNRGYVNDAVAVFRAMIDAAFAPPTVRVKLSERPNTDPSPTQA